MTGVLVNIMGRKIALTRLDKEQLAQRLASLTSIGKTVSLRYSTEELVRAMGLLLECNQRLIFSRLDESLVLQQTLVQIVHGDNQPAPHKQS